MKTLILYRVILYSILLCLSGIILVLLNTMNSYPYSSKNMRTAFYSGCNIGLHATLTSESISRCIEIANMYKETLDDLEKQADR